MAHIEEAAAARSCPRSSSAGTRSRSSSVTTRSWSSSAEARQVCLDHIEDDIQAAEKELDDDAESIITNERYVYIASIIQGCLQEEERRQADRPPTRSIRSSPTAGWLCPSLPSSCSLFTIVSVTTVGAWATGLGERRRVRRRLAPASASAPPLMRKPPTNMRDASNIVNGYIEDQGLDDDGRCHRQLRATSLTPRPPQLR